MSQQQRWLSTTRVDKEQRQLNSRELARGWVTDRSKSISINIAHARGHIFFQTDPTMSTYLERQILLLLVWGIHSSWRVDLDSPCPLLYNGVTDQYKYTGAPKERKRNGRQIRITFSLIYIKCWIKGVTCILE